MPIEKRPDAEPIRGYRLIERLGYGGYGEVWKCEAPGGIFKAIKFVYGSLNGLDNDSGHAEEELRALQLIKSIRHPFLLSIDRVECLSGEVVIITELADRNLHELMEQYLAQGLPGIPRGELLDYLLEVAEVLDLLNQKFDLQHLDIKPHNLFLVSNHVKVADFGLVNSLSGGVTAKLQATMNAVTPLYAAPELFLGSLSRHCDQYSLAIVYHELLTGKLPFQGKNMRQLLLQHTQENPDLQLLSMHDRVVVTKALAKNPDHRFASCRDFMCALRAESAPLLSKEDSDWGAISVSAPMSETAQIRLTDTALLKRPAAPVLPKNVLENHRFVECVANSPLLEIWRVQTPEGVKRRVQFVYGLGGLEADRLKEALARLQSMLHPGLLAPRLIHAEPGRVILMTENLRETMRDRFQDCQKRKLPGIPRTELVDYLRAAAEVLDYLYQQHNIQHLNLNPRLLILDNGWLQLAEFGYAQILWDPASQDIAQRNLRYAAPELLTQKLSRHCDQYTLALIYAEMLTGVHPFGGLNPQSYLSKKKPPNLDRLAELDREIIGRALSADPQSRWSSCTEMLLALEGTSVEQQKQQQEHPDPFAKMVDRDKHKPSTVEFSLPPIDLHETIAQLINANGGHVIPILSSKPSMNSHGDTVEYCFHAGLPLGSAHERMQAFCLKMFAKMVRQDEASCLLLFDLPGTFWQQWWGQQPKLELLVEMARVNLMSATPIEVKARLKATHCSKKKAHELLKKMSLDLLENLKQQLIVNGEKRTADRLLWPHPITIIPIDSVGQREEPIECRGKDLSQTGIGFYLPHELTTSEVLIEVPNTLHPPAVTIPAILVRAKRCADGWYDVGAIFRIPALRRSFAEMTT
jgi:serine/threonine protein kinase